MDVYFAIMTYPDSVRYLYALGNEIKTVKLGLDRVRTVLAALGNPQDRYSVVHVAGTNGKGSTCAMIEAGLRHDGVRTGLYTSPHLVEPTERVRMNGVAVSAEMFADAFGAVHEASEMLLAEGTIDMHPTYFETVTAMAFLLFAQADIDMLVCEVGMGGRLDATNVVKPELCVITPIDYDHELYLGNTLTKIAGEKAGILKPGVPAVFAPQHAEADAVLHAELQGPLIALPEIHDLEEGPFHCRYRTDRFEVECPLAGPHQVVNSLVAATALHALGLSTAGISNTVWPGRLERVARDPDIILDGAHNPAGAKALAEYITTYFKGRRKVHLIYGTMRDKAVDEVTGLLFPLADRLILTAPDNARALHPDALQQPGAVIAANVAEALRIALEGASKDDVVLLTGSLYLVGEARPLLVKP
ncbi:bifunctional folylpolyglutamate synthase/dihydrofolate synthase [Bryobacterales bacterium F-183]|nr:bifunctional folylpolyglutamate synthase/dihydrofolate synthase [Bryobacterales bacterium F-183]